MKVFLFCLSLMLLADFTFADVWVNGYTRKNGSYVKGHYRSKQNKSKFDNYSSFGRINPHTGRFGAKMPW
ncbi:MAG: hypothetical protein PUB35_03505 [Campylobacteraceae bacterium]|nr:hypothetical protein [Campylobacteraceae bacterium]